jgi:hypothetical protein
MQKLMNLLQRPNQNEKTSFFFTLLLTFTTLILTNIDKIKSDSGDMAHHYILAHGISQDWEVDFEGATNLGGMNFYPHFTHALAAFVGYPFNSVFLGMQIVSLFSVALIWTILVRVLWQRSPKPLLAAMSLFMIVFTMRILKLNILPGSEIVDNYFYPQLVGSSLLLLTLYILISNGQEGYRGLLTAQYFTGVLGAMMINLHLLPALVLIGISFFLTIAKYVSADSRESFRKHQIALDVGMQTLVLSYLFTSPSLSNQSASSQTDGELKLSLINYPGGYWVVVLLSLLGSAWRVKKILNKKDDRTSVSHYWTFFGLSVTCIAALQGVLMNFGFGSNYAFKKYVFLVVSYLVVELANITSNLFSKEHKYYKESSFGVFAASCLAFTVLAYPVVMDTSKIVKIEKELELIKTSILPEPDLGKSNVIDLVDDYPSINYMFAISKTNTKFEDASREILQLNNVVNYSRYSYVVGSKLSYKYQQYKNCESLTYGEIYVIESKCIQEVLSKRSECSGIWDFSNQGLIPLSTLTGFGQAESGGRWTTGGDSTISCEISEALPSKVVIDFTPYFYEEHIMQRVNVSVNERNIRDYEFTNKSTDMRIEIELTGSLKLAKEKELVIMLQTPDSISPVDLKHNTDTRKLGIFITKMTFTK